MKPRVIITGASGVVGEAVVDALEGRYELILLDRRPHDRYSVREIDITDWGSLYGAVPAADVLIHLAAIPMEAEPERIVRTNIQGTLNVFEVARIRNIRRIVFASTIMTYWGYGGDRPAVPLQPSRHDWPTTHYAVSKLYGEQLGRIYSASHGISVICIRLGWYPRTPVDRNYFEQHIYNLISVGDCKRLFEHCVSVENVDYAVVNGCSLGGRHHYDLESAHESIGFYPVDSPEEAARQHTARPGFFL